MCIAARRSGRAWCSGSISAAPAAASPTGSRQGKRAETIAYLRGREQVTSVYRETLRSVTLLAEPQRRVPALVYMIDRGHQQYAGRLDLATQLHLVRQGHGQSGPNREYVLSTVHALEALGLYDRDLHLLAEKLRGAHEQHVQEP